MNQRLGQTGAGRTYDELKSGDGTKNIISMCLQYIFTYYAFTTTNYQQIQLSKSFHGGLTSMGGGGPTQHTTQHSRPPTRVKNSIVLCLRFSQGVNILLILNLHTRKRP
jgi:hypothetical protein